MFYRTSCPEVFCKKGVLRNYTKFTGKLLCQSLYFYKVAGLACNFKIKCGKSVANEREATTTAEI